MREALIIVMLIVFIAIFFDGVRRSLLARKQRLTVKIEKDIIKQGDYSEGADVLSEPRVVEREHAVESEDVLFEQRMDEEVQVSIQNVSVQEESLEIGSNESLSSNEHLNKYEEPVIGSLSSVDLAADVKDDVVPLEVVSTEEVVRTEVTDRVPSISDVAMGNVSTIHTRENLPRETEALEAAHSDTPTEKLVDHLISLHIMPPEGFVFPGDALHPLLLNKGFVFEPSLGVYEFKQFEGQTLLNLCYLANAHDEGVFDLNSIESSDYYGVTVFFALPYEGDALKGFDQVISIVQSLTEEMGATCLDAEGSTLTNQSISHLRSEVIDYLRGHARSVVNG